MYYLGCDSGGSKTAFLLVNESGSVISTSLLRASDYQLSDSDFVTLGIMFSDGITQVCKDAMIHPEDIAFSFLGITGFNESPEQDEACLHEITKVLPSERICCVNDIVIGWAGSLACQSGINLISGTGSNSYGQDSHGNSARAGGWGYFCGDEGSSYWLGRRLLSVYTKEVDGRLPRDAVYDVVREAFQITSDFDFRYGRCVEISQSRSEVANLQRLLLKAAQLGSLNAIELYRQAADELAQMVKTIIQKLDFGLDNEIKVSYSGGTFQAGKFLLDPLNEQLSIYHAKLVSPQMSPVFGAALAAITVDSGACIPRAEIIEHLTNQDKHYFHS